MIKKLLDRVKNINNSQNNLGWGICHCDPMMHTEKIEDTVNQIVIVVGHSIYKKVYTMFIEEFSDELFRLSVVNSKYKFEVVKYGNSDSIISEIISQLKIWYPEIRREK